MADVICQVCGTPYPVGTVQCALDHNILVGQPSPPASSPPPSARADEQQQTSEPGASARVQPTRRADTYRLVGSGIDVEVAGQLNVGRDPVWSPLGEQLSERDLVSARHATLWQEDGRLHIRDQGSTNGTYVDGQWCEPGEPCNLHLGASVRLSSQLVLTVHGGTAQQ